MKRLMILCMMSLWTIFMCAQQKDVTTFLGIPVDGTRAAMRQKLIQKGFVSKRTTDGDEYFRGRFNGTNVNVRIVTNNNKVCRLYIADDNTISETDIRIRFNNLILQFKNNERYVSWNTNNLIPENEDISYELLIHNKVYEANFYQIGNIDKLNKSIYDMLVRKYGTAEIEKLTEDELKSLYQDYAVDIVKMKSVWFRIFELYGKYYIGMFYDNEYNQANGEDL